MSQISLFPAPRRGGKLLTKVILPRKQLRGFFFEIMNRSEIPQFRLAQIESAQMEKNLGFPVDFLIHPNGEKVFYTQRIDSELHALGLPESEPLQDPLALPRDILATIAAEKFRRSRIQPLTAATLTKLEMFGMGRKPSDILKHLAKREANRSVDANMGEGMQLRRLSADQTEEFRLSSVRRDSNSI